MSVNWNLYLSRYQEVRGGCFFGALDDDYDCHLILTEGEPSPVLVWIDTDPADGYSEHNLLARTMVRLDGEYDLHIRARSLVGSVAGIVSGGAEFGCPEVTRGRLITTNNKALTKRVLENEDLRRGLIACKETYLKVRPAPRKKEGWHVVEVADIDFENSAIGDSPWLSEAMTRDPAHLKEDQQEAVLKAGSDHFNSQMDVFLDLLRAARQAVTDQML